jgi:hypothetical protein
LTTVVPTGKKSPGLWSGITLATAQLSVTVGAVQVTLVPQAVASAGTSTFGGHVVKFGGVLSMFRQQIGCPPTLSPPVTVKLPKVVPIFTPFEHEVLMLASTTSVVRIVT